MSEYDGIIWMPIVYDDEDNVPMTEDPVRKFTTYTSKAEMKADERGEALPFTDPPDGCWNCTNFDWKHEACTSNWNNLDDSYYNPDCDDRKLTDFCDAWEEDKDADPECLEAGGNEP